MEDDKIFEYLFPDGIPACIQKHGHGKEPDHVDLQTFDFFSSIDERLEQGTTLFPNDFDEIRKDCVETFEEILLEKLHLGYKIQAYKKIETTIKETVSFDISRSNPVEVKKHRDQVSQLRCDAVLAYNNIIKSLEYIEFISFGTQYELESFWKNMRHAELTCRKQAKDTMNSILILTTPT